MKWLIIGTYLLSTMCIHWRGKWRLPLARQMVDRSTLLSPLNLFVYVFSGTPTTPLVSASELPELAPLREHWRAIHAEAENLKALSEAGAVKGGWRNLYLKWYDAAQPAARSLCPRTYALLQAIPLVKLASFIELPPGESLMPHRDPYAGWLRYHLGLATPNDDACYMEVDGRRYSWRDGQAMLFDETYVHRGENGCARGRLVLLCDVERPMRFRWAQAVNNWFGRLLAAAMSAPDGAGEHPPQGMAFRVVRALAGFRRWLSGRSTAGYRAAIGATLAAAAVLLYLL